MRTARTSSTSRLRSDSVLMTGTVWMRRGARAHSRKSDYNLPPQLLVAVRSPPYFARGKTPLRLRSGQDQAKKEDRHAAYQSPHKFNVQTRPIDCPTCSSPDVYVVATAPTGSSHIPRHKRPDFLRKVQSRHR